MAYKKPLTARGGGTELNAQMPLRNSNFFYKRLLTALTLFKKTHKKSSILVQKQKNRMKFFGILHKYWRYSSIYLDTPIPHNPTPSLFTRHSISV